MLKADVFVGFIVLCLIAVITILGIIKPPTLHPHLHLAQTLKVTDLCLFTEARYTRHPAVSDRHSAFADSPSALDYFPSGSILSPPHTLKQ